MGARVEVAGGWVEERVLEPGNPPDWEWRVRPWEPHPGMWEKRPSAVKTKRGGPAGGGRCGEQGGRQVLGVGPGEVGQCTCCGGTPSTVLLTFGAGEQDRGGACAGRFGQGKIEGAAIAGS